LRRQGDIGVIAAAECWGEADARLYAAYCVRHDTYRSTSEHLVAAAAAATARPWAGRVVDLACGTGATALAAVERFGTGIDLTCLDKSAHMLALAQAMPALESVRAKFVHGAGEKLDRLVAPGVDLVLCNSAFWLMDMPSALRAIAATLAPGGLFAMSIPGYLVHNRADHAPLSDTPALMAAFARAVHSRQRTAAGGYGGSSYSIGEDSLGRSAARAGFEPLGRQACELLESAHTTYDALCMPALLDGYAATLPSDERLPLLNQVWRAHGSAPPTRVAWYAYLFRSTPPQDRT